jgi:protein SCO1
VKLLRVLPLGVALGLMAGVAFVPKTACASTAQAAEIPGVADPSAPGATVKDDGVISDGVDIIENLGEEAQIDVPLVDQNGNIHRLRDYLGKRPAIVALVYYRCPVLCSLLLQGLVTALKQVDWQVGRDFDVLTVSIDPNETTAMAKEKRRGFLQALGRPEEERLDNGAWPFFTAATEAVDVLSASLGFKFKYVERERQFAHVAALFFLSPQGKITRYLYGVNFDPKEVKLALFESAQGRVGTPLERVLLRCYKFDPASRHYHLWIRNYYRVWGVIILLCLGTFLGTLWRREFKKTAPKANA